MSKLSSEQALMAAAFVEARGCRDCAGALREHAQSERDDETWPTYRPAADRGGLRDATTGGSRAPAIAASQAQLVEFGALKANGLAGDLTLESFIEHRPLAATVPQASAPAAESAFRALQAHGLAGGLSPESFRAYTAGAPSRSEESAAAPQDAAWRALVSASKRADFVPRMRAIFDARLERSSPAGNVSYVAGAPGSPSAQLAGPRRGKVSI